MKVTGIAVEVASPVTGEVLSAWLMCCPVCRSNPSRPSSFLVFQIRPGHLHLQCAECDTTFCGGGCEALGMIQMNRPTERSHSTMPESALNLARAYCCFARASKRALSVAFSAFSISSDSLCSAVRFSSACTATMRIPAISPELIVVGVPLVPTSS